VNDLALGPDDVVVGHSSGALLAMRLLEGERKIKGAVLVACAHTDLGDENERASEYFDLPWQFDKMKNNAGARRVRKATQGQRPSCPYLTHRLNHERNPLCSSLCPIRLGGAIPQLRRPPHPCRRGSFCGLRD
jgi:pimeloyl-ACP methyl ester carboxylesterase